MIKRFIAMGLGFIFCCVCMYCAQKSVMNKDYEKAEIYKTQNDLNNAANIYYYYKDYEKVDALFNTAKSDDGQLIGSVNGTSYINDVIGFTFTPPDNWLFMDDELKTRLFGSTYEIADKNTIFEKDKQYILCASAQFVESDFKCVLITGINDLVATEEECVKKMMGNNKALVGTNKKITLLTENDYLGGYNSEDMNFYFTVSTKNDFTTIVIVMADKTVDIEKDIAPMFKSNI